MKKYLVTEIPTPSGMGDILEVREELPPGAKVLTREEVATLIAKHTHQSSEGLSDYAESLDSLSMLDELFGDTP